MKTKEPVKIKKQTVAVQDLPSRKNPKGGFLVGSSVGMKANPRPKSSGISDQAAAGNLTSF